MARNQTRSESYEVCLMLPSAEQSKLLLCENSFPVHDSSHCMS